MKVNKVMMQYLNVLQRTLDFLKKILFVAVATVSSDRTVLQRARH